MGVEAEGSKVHFGVARIDVHLPDAQSLKDKRATLRRVQAALAGQGCSVAEVGAQDRWQRAVLGVAIVASSAQGVERVITGITSVIERDPRIVVLDVTDLIDDLAT